MDDQSVLLNDKWKNYFNWTILYPTIFFALILLGGLMFFLSSFLTFGEPSHSKSMDWTNAAIIGFVIIFILFLITMLVYVLWFIVASDTMFKLLNINRVAGNVLNLVGLFIFGGLPFLILPIFFWIKMRDYWQDRGQKYNWRATAVN